MQILTPDQASTGMQVNEIEYEGQPPIDSYGPDFFRVAGEIHSGGLVLGPQGLQAWAGLADPDSLLDLGGKVDLLFVGMGADIAPLPAQLRGDLEKLGIGCEIMTTPSACRTYNVLLAEGRRVALAAIAM